MQPAVNRDNRQFGIRVAKAALLDGGRIGSDTCRHPAPSLHPDMRAMPLDLLRPLNPGAVRRGRWPARL